MDNRLWKSDMEDGRFCNPVLFADYSDPDVIRVKDMYYMTASSFNYTPGLPILVSRDLVNWKLVNYAVDRIDGEAYRLPAHAKGIWAPAIRYHEGEFYIYYGMPDEGIFMVHAKDPLGAFSAPVLVLEGKGLIDPCPLWDEDGKAYVVHGYARSRIGFKSIIGMFPMSWDGTKAVGEDHFIFDGTVTQKTIEGPKIYIRDKSPSQMRSGEMCSKWYYIFAPAGGVKTGWQTVLRSEHIEGPYEEKIVMSQKDTPINGPHQGGLVDTIDGQEWFVHFQDRGAFGRITHLQPVCWREDGWPVIGEMPDENGCGQPCLVHDKPSAPGFESEIPFYLEASDDFLDGKPGLMWQWAGNSQSEFLNKDAKPGRAGLRFNCLCIPEEGRNQPDSPLTAFPLLWNCPNLLTQKLICPEFRARTTMDIRNMKAGELAGLMMLGGQYAYVGICKTAEGVQLIYAQSEGEEENRYERILLIKELEKEVKTVCLELTFSLREGMKAAFGYGVEHGKLLLLEEPFCPTNHTWVGARFGMFAICEAGIHHPVKDIAHGYVEFSAMAVEANQS